MPFEGYKVQKRDIQKKSQDNLSSKEDKRKQIRAVITDQFGNDSGPMVWDNELTRQLWVREVGTSSPSRVYCYNITPDQLGIGVIVGYETGSNMREVLRSDKEFYAPTNTTGASYESPGIIDLRAGGRTNLWIESKMIAPLSTYPDSTGLVVNVVSGDYPYAGARVTFPGQTGITLVQNPNVGEHYFAGLYLDSTNILNVIYGASVAVASAPPEPAWPAGAFELSVVRINHTQTKIVLSIQTDPLNDIFDRRMLFGDENSTGVEIEDEGVDQGFASTLDFTGAGVTASVAGGLATINISAGWPFDSIKTVSPTNANANFTTIQGAINSIAANGSICILVDPAIYTENLTIDSRKVVIASIGGDPRIEITTNIVNINGTVTVNCATQNTELSIINCRVEGAMTASSAASAKTIRVYLRGVFAFSVGSTRLTLTNNVNCFIDDCFLQYTSGDVISASLTSTAFALRIRNAIIVGNIAIAPGTLDIDATSYSTSTTVSGAGTVNLLDGALNGGTWLEKSGGLRIKESSLVAALSAAVDGDATHIYPGTITAAQTIADSITVYGDGANQTILTQSASSTNTVTVTDTNVTLRNLKVDNTGGGSSAAALVTDQAGFLADSCIFAKSAGAPTNGACVGVLGGDATFRDCDVSSSSGSDKYGYSISGGTVTLIGGSASGATFDLLISGSTTVVELRGVKLLNSLIDVSGGALVKGWYLDANDKVIILNGSHIVQPSLPNGDLEVWQSGTSFAAAADGTLTADNWKYFKVGVAVHTVSRSTDVPTVAQAGRLLNYSLLADCTTIDASIAAGDFVVMRTAIEGYDWTDYAQVAFPYSFWHKHTKTGTYCVAFRNTGLDRSFVAEYTQAVTDTWELATVFVLPSPTTGTWDYTNGTGLVVTFTLSCGSTFQTTAGAWQTGNYLGTSNQVNATDNTANNFRLALIGNNPDIPYLEKLAKCQRYLYVPDATLNTVNVMTGGKFSTTVLVMNRYTPVPMRAAPTLTHNVTGYTAGNPTTTTIAALDFSSGGYSTITGALTLAATSTNVDTIGVSLTAGTSFSGGVGGVYQLRIGPSVLMQFLASL